MSELSSNKRARFDYEILEEYEAGISLFGFEAKSTRIHHMNISGAFVVLRGGEAWLLNASIPPYQAKNTPSPYDPERTRKLLLHQRELKELIGKSAQKGLTVIPIRVYTKRGKIKVLIAIARHKKTRDKREVIKKREARREMDKAAKGDAGIRRIFE